MKTSVFFFQHLIFFQFEIQHLTASNLNVYIQHLI